MIVFCCNVKCECTEITLKRKKHSGKPRKYHTEHIKHHVCQVHPE